MSSEVTFEEEDSSNRVGNIQIVLGAPTGMLAWLVKNKVVANARQAEMFLLGVCIIFVLIAITALVLGNPTKPIVKDFSKTDVVPSSINSP